ncbi:hypothetical protein, partial [Salmonella enterica]|uniref:hypothetical protein n=1 Tax=Salmonella enterica TaxID=28901 RepID=UPI00398C4FE3
VDGGIGSFRRYVKEGVHGWRAASQAQSGGEDSGRDDTHSDGGAEGGTVTPPDAGGDGGHVTPPDDGGAGGDVTPPDHGGAVAPQYRADIGASMGHPWLPRNPPMPTLPDRRGPPYPNSRGPVLARAKRGYAHAG